MTYEEAEAIILDMATSGDDYGWPERFTRTFCAKIKATYSVASVNRPVLAEFGSEDDCRFCRKTGIAILEGEKHRKSCACICERGRALFESWRSKDPKTFDLSARPDWIKALEYQAAEDMRRAEAYEKRKAESRDEKGRVQRVDAVGVPSELVQVRGASKEPVLGLESNLSRRDERRQGAVPGGHITDGIRDDVDPWS